MRTLTDHIVEGDSANHQLKIAVLDEPGQGGACHNYRISDDAGPNQEAGFSSCSISFQNGPIKEAGVNGVTHEALLAIVIDRLRSFEKGPFASHYNAAALDSCEQALSHLQGRTRERMKRGVEGTHQK